MKKNKKIMTLALLTIIFAITTTCKKSIICLGGKNTNSGIIVSEFDFGDCFDKYFVQGDEWVITNVNEYQTLEDTLQRYSGSGCDTAKLPIIDFSQYTLLGKRASGKCQVHFKREVINDESNSQYIYEIKVKQCGLCNRIVTNMNWILVPKLPYNYSVKFILK